MMKQRKSKLWIVILAIISIAILLIPVAVKLFKTYQQSSFGDGVNAVANASIPSWWDTMTAILQLGAIICIVILLLVLWYSAKVKQDRWR